IEAADVEVDVRVDATLLQLRDEVIETVELLGVDRDEVFFPDALGRRIAIHVMEAHAVHAELREAAGDLGRVLLRGEIRGEGRIYAPDTQTLARPVLGRAADVEMSVGDVNVAARPRGAGQQTAEVGDARRGVIPRQDEGKHL